MAVTRPGNFVEVRITGWDESTGWKVGAVKDWWRHSGWTLAESAALLRDGRSSQVLKPSLSVLCEIAERAGLKVHTGFNLQATPRTDKVLTVTWRSILDRTPTIYRNVLEHRLGGDVLELDELGGTQYIIPLANILEITISHT